MAIFSRLFGGGAATPEVAIRSTAPGLNSIDIPSRRFHGVCQSSPNGRYTVAWRDSNDEGTRGGARSEGSGRYLLLAGEAIAAEGRMERPNDGKVADNGTFILNDWQFFTNETRGTFCAFRANGAEILRRTFKANLFNNGLSSDGRYACCQTCNSSDESDSSVLTIFDLEKGAEVASWRPESGWAEGYSFSDDGQHILLSYLHRPPLRYTLKGDFLDRNCWIDWALDQGDLHMIHQLIKETNPKPQGTFARRLIESADKALSAARTDDRGTRAWALKLKGTCLDGLEEYSAALLCYEEGLALNPKLGVKRRVEQLRKKLTSKA